MSGLLSVIASNVESLLGSSADSSVSALISGGKQSKSSSTTTSFAESSTETVNSDSTTISLTNSLNNFPQLPPNSVRSLNHSFPTLPTTNNFGNINHLPQNHHHRHHRIYSSFLSESPTFMLISGITSKREQCLVADAPDKEGSSLHLEPCEQVVKKNNGFELFRFMDNGAMYTLMGRKCLTLLDNDAKKGGVIELADCDKASGAGDGRNLWEPTANSQFKMGRPGDWCLTMGPNGVDVGLANVATGNGVTVEASDSEASGLHGPQNVV
jgi:hypothetical protein